MNKCKKLRLIFATTCVCILMLLVLGVFLLHTTSQPKHPLSYVKLASIKKAELTVSRPNPVTVDINSNDHLKKLVKILHRIVIYDENTEWRQYNGGVTGYKLTFQNGTTMEIMVISSIIAINGLGYNSDSSECRKLVDLVDQILSHKIK